MERFHKDEEEFARFNSPGDESSAQDMGSEVVDVSVIMTFRECTSHACNLLTSYMPNLGL